MGKVGQLARAPNEKTTPFRPAGKRCFLLVHLVISFARTSMRYRFPNKSSTSMRTDISDGLCLTDANARTRTSVPEYGATVTGVSFRFMKDSSSDDTLYFWLSMTIQAPSSFFCQNA